MGVAAPPQAKKKSFLIIFSDQRRKGGLQPSQTANALSIINNRREMSYLPNESLHFTQCGASEAKRHIGITLPVVCLSVCYISFAFAGATCVLRNTGHNFTAIRF